VATSVNYLRFLDRQLVRYSPWTFLAKATATLNLAKFVNLPSVVIASIYRFSLIFIFHANDVAWTLADAQTWCVVETAAGVISACLPTTAPLVKTCTKGFISTARSLSRSNLTHSGTQNLSKGDAGGTGSNSAAKRMMGLRVEGTHRSNGSYGLSEMGPGSRESPHLKGKGWTIISADVESD
jgi:hypothetical protein